MSSQMRYHTLDDNSPEYSQELPSLQRVQEAPEGLVCQEVQQVQQYQLVPSHQETPRKVQDHKDSTDYIRYPLSEYFILKLDGLIYSNITV